MFVVGNFGKRRRSLHVPAAAEDASSDILKTTVREQQQLLAGIRKDLENLCFIVNHLNQDAKCILDVSAGELAKATEDQMSLLSYTFIESSVMEKAALESERNDLRAKLESLNSEHKMLIEQQVSSEEAMMDELARLMTENDQLKKRTVPTVEVEIQELESLVSGIEATVQPSQIVNSFEATKNRITSLEQELKEREDRMAQVASEMEQMTATLHDQSRQLQIREEESTKLQVQLEQMQSKVS